MPAAALIQFPSTQWSLLQAASTGPSPLREHAMARLVGMYAAPIRAFIASRKRIRPDQVDDLTQDFLMLGWLGQDFFRDIRAEKGQFRAYLLVSLRNFVSRWLRRNARHVAPPFGSRVFRIADHRGRGDRQFWQAWAIQVVRAAVLRFNAHYAEQRRHDVMEIFDARIVKPCLEGHRPIPYAALVDTLHLTSPIQAANLLMTAKRGFIRILKEVLAEYDDGEDPDDQARELLRLLRLPE